MSKIAFLFRRYNFLLFKYKNINNTMTQVLDYEGLKYYDKKIKDFVQVQDSMRVDVNSYLSTIDIDKIISEADNENI